MRTAFPTVYSVNYFSISSDKHTANNALTDFYKKTIPTLMKNQTSLRIT